MPRFSDPASLPWRIAGRIVTIVADSRFMRLCTQSVRFNIWKARLGALGSDSKIYPRIVIHSPDMVYIGRNVAIAEFVHIWGGGGVTIGDHTMIASHCAITSQTHETNPNARRTNILKAVKIGRNVWIGTGATIMPGVTVGDDAIIAAGAIVTRDVASGATVSGMPARSMGVRLMPQGGLTGE